MTFEIVRILLLALEPNIDGDINDYKVIIYSLEPLRLSKPILYKDIPDCFNCKVHLFDIDFDEKIILIKSEVVNDGRMQ